MDDIGERTYSRSAEKVDRRHFKLLSSLLSEVESPFNVSSIQQSYLSCPSPHNELLCGGNAA